MKRIKNKQYIVFYIGLAVKIILSIFFASKVLSHSFIPFVQYFVSSGFQNPYVYFASINKNIFPYPSIMLYILAVPQYLFGWISNNQFFLLFIYRLPLLFSDLAIFFILKSWLTDKFFLKLTWFYWLSPVLLYISYIHGQLDVIPIAILFGALYFLFKDKFYVSVLFLGLAMATKTHIIIVYPFFFLYLLSKPIRKDKLLLLTCIPIICFLVVNFPFLMSESFVNMVLRNPEQTKVFDLSINFNSFLIFYITPASLVLLFIRCILLRQYNRDVFIMFLGFAFSLLLLFVPPMRGWYYWLIPFLAYFYTKQSVRSSLLFFALQGLYIVYFFLPQNTNHLEVLQFIFQPETHFVLYHDLLRQIVSDSKLANLVFTCLQTTLLVTCFWVYKEGLESYRKQKLTYISFLIGIGGDSGSGKSYLSQALNQLFVPSNVLIIRGDDMHKWERGNKQWQQYTHLNPKANNLHSEIPTLRLLKQGKPIVRRHYDHSVGKFTNDKVIKPKKIVIFEGLHPFYLTEQRRLYDLKIFIDLDSELVKHRKVIRDTQDRGYEASQILQEIEKRQRDMQTYIEQQRDKADIIIEGKTEEPIKNIGDSTEKIIIYYNLLISNSFDIGNLLEALQTVDSLLVDHYYMENDRQCLTIKGRISMEEIIAIAFNYIPELENIGITNSVWHDGVYGVLLLVLTYLIFEQAQYSK